MSVVIAIKDKDRYIFGSDEQVTCGNKVEHNAIKIWDVIGIDGAIMGGVGTNRASQVLQYKKFIDRNDFQEDEDIDTSFIVNSVIPCIVQALSDNGVGIQTSTNKDINDTTYIPNEYIFAYKDKAWEISQDLSVSEIGDYYAIGSGEEIAQGVLFATKEYKEKNPFKRIVMSIDAASSHTTYVDSNISFLSTVDYDEDIKLQADALGIPIKDYITSVYESLGYEVPQEVLDKFVKETKTKKCVKGKK